MVSGKIPQQIVKKVVNSCTLINKTTFDKHRNLILLLVFSAGIINGVISIGSRIVILIMNQS